MDIIIEHFELTIYSNIPVLETVHTVHTYISICNSPRSNVKWSNLWSLQLRQLKLFVRPKYFLIWDARTSECLSFLLNKLLKRETIYQNCCLINQLTNCFSTTPKQILSCLLLSTSKSVSSQINILLYGLIKVINEDKTKPLKVRKSY